MKFRIHRGASEIGGSCVEITSEGKSLVIDVGLPLESASAAPELLPPVEGIADGENPDLLGIVISHIHGDHIGLAPAVHPRVPLYVGSGALRLLNAVAPFLRTEAMTASAVPYIDRAPFELGPFRITPYLMDHSGFDAYSLLIEAEGKRLLYSGDFRGHGRKSWAFEAFIKSPPQYIDALLMEGTALSREATAVVTEHELEERIWQALRRTDGISLACFSAQNIDRFVTIFKATVRSGRTLIVDAYMANILTALAIPSLPSPLRPQSRLRVFLPKAQKSMIARSRRFDLAEPFRSSRIFIPEIAEAPNRWVMLFRQSMMSDLSSVSLDQGLLIWSMWPGYLDTQSSNLREWSKEQRMDFEVHHVSGHADVSDLKRYAKAVSPSKLIPIHTTRPEFYPDLFPNIEQLHNGQWFDLA